MRRYREFEHTADIGVEIYGKTLEEIFSNAGYALFDTLVDITTILPTVQRAIHVTGNDAEALLMNWLRELLFLSSVYGEVYAEFVIQTLQPNVIHAVIKGEVLDLERHHFKTELKAITYHHFALVQKNGRWEARVIFDV